MQVLFPTGTSRRIGERPEEGRYMGDPAVVGPVALPTPRGVVKRPRVLSGEARIKSCNK